MEIKEKPNQGLLLTINNQLFWEILLLEIIGKTIAYSSYKKKQENNREAELIKEIENLEKRENSNFEACDKKKKELQDLRQKRLEGVRIRSRAKWINEGEKPSTYFCNLENRNFTSKAMNNLFSSTSNVLRCLKEEVLNEVDKFYSNL